MNGEELLRQLREENEALRKRNGELVQESEALQQLVAGLRGQVRELQQGLTAAEERIAELERTKKEPPVFIKPNKPKGEGPKAPRRKRAAERNHARLRAEQVTRREEHHIARCPACQCKLRKEREAWRRQVIDLPPPQAVEVTEHVVYKGYCPRCGVWKHARPALGGQVVGQRRFGARLMVLVGYLSQSLRLPQEEIQRYLQMVHGLQVSVGAIADLRRGLAERLRPVVEELKEQLRGSAIVHGDETGWREDGRNGYVWAFSTPGEEGLRYYRYAFSRGQQVVAEVLGEEFQGVLASDFHGAYNVYRGRHQRCWVHLLRDLHALKEAYPAEEGVQAWAQAVRALYDRGQAFVQAGEQRAGEREQLYVALVGETERLGLLYARAKHPCRALAKRLLRHQDELFQFVLVAGLAADNNLAERSLRPLVVARKISGGTRSAQGSETRMLLATVFATLAARGQNPLTGCLALIAENS